jgi:NAD(P)-dependent dehydrogenase (short-subunit alcohol dehydrogenase family)
MNILITGGSSGLGKAVVEALAADEANTVYFTWRARQGDSDALCARFPNARAYELDLTRRESLDGFLAAMDAMNIDALVNNAYCGLPQGTHFHKTRPEDFLTEFASNLVPTIEITQKALEGFRRKKFGKTINVLSACLINLPPASYAIYSANKAYLQQLSKVWNKEYARYNITSNCVLPEYMKTSFSQTDERVVEQMEASHPLKKLLTPEETAEVVKFLVYAHQQVNGVMLPVNAAQAVM